MTRTLNKKIFSKTKQRQQQKKKTKKRNQKVLNESAKALVLVPPRESHAAGDSAATFRKEKFHGAQVPFTSSHHEGRPALLVT